MCLDKEEHYFFTSGNRIKLHYLRWKGKGNATPIVCVHGITSNCRYYSALAEELTRERDVYSYDLRGRGDSDKPEFSYGIECHALDLHNFISHLNLPAVHLLGHSFGAAIIVYYLTHYPSPAVQKVILVEGGTDYLPNVKEQFQPSIDRLAISFISLDHFWEYMKKNVPYYQPWNEYYERYLFHDIEVKPDGWVIPRTPLVAVLEDLASLKKIKLADLLPKVDKKVLVLRATRGFRNPRDHIITAEQAREMIRALPKGKLVEVPHTHHISIVLGKAAFSAQFIKKFLNDIPITGRKYVMPKKSE